MFSTIVSFVRAGLAVRLHLKVVAVMNAGLQTSLMSILPIPVTMLKGSPAPILQHALPNLNNSNQGYCARNPMLWLCMWGHGEYPEVAFIKYPW